MSIGYLFGCLEASAVPGPVLVKLLGDLGISPAAARQGIARLVAQSDLVATRVGRVAVYELSGEFLRRWLRIRHGDGPKPWAGTFECIVYDVPETRRALRDELRHAASRAGFGIPRPGLILGLESPRPWVTPFENAREQGQVLVEVGELEVDLPTARRLTEAGWQLPERRDRLHEALATLRSHASDGPPVPSQALAKLYEVYLVSTAARLESPNVPRELLGPDWPAETVRTLVDELTDRYCPAVEVYLTESLQTNPHAGLIRQAAHPHGPIAEPTEPADPAEPPATLVLDDPVPAGVGDGSADAHAAAMRE